MSNILSCCLDLRYPKPDPNPTRNPDFEPLPDPNPTRSQKVLPVRPWRGGLPNSYNHLSLHSLFENSEKCNAGKIPIKFLRGVPNPLQMLYWYPRAQQIMIQCAEEQKNFKIRIPNIMKFEITLLIRHS